MQCTKCKYFCCGLHLDWSFFNLPFYLKTSIKVACSTGVDAIILPSCDTHCLGLKFRCFQCIWHFNHRQFKQFKHNNYQTWQSKLQLIILHSPFSLRIEYFDWKIDNSTGIGLIAPKITTHYIVPILNKLWQNGVLTLGSYDEFTSMPINFQLVKESQGSKSITQYCPILLYHNKKKKKDYNAIQANKINQIFQNH